VLRLQADEKLGPIAKRSASPDRTTTKETGRQWCRSGSKGQTPMKWALAYRCLRLQGSVVAVEIRSFAADDVHERLGLKC
jgi:hypothetical protein